MNSDNYHLFILGNKFELLWTNIGNNRIGKNWTVKLLGITIDNELKFGEHLSNVCLKANKKLSALIRIRKYLDLNTNSNTALLSGFFLVEMQIEE